MSRTHHATRTWRLSCGCLRDYPGMPLNKVHKVLCPVCNEPVTTLYAYEERRCGFTRLVSDENSQVHVSCTRDPGNKDCARGVHFDKFVQVRFTGRGKLRASREGQVTRP